MTTTPAVRVWNPRLRFSTDGPWRTEDLGTFVSVIQAMHDVFAMYREASLHHWMLEFLPHTLSPYLSRFEFGIQVAPDVPKPLGPALASLRAKTFAEIRDTATMFHIEPLRIGRVQMASPGSISFDGLGEPLKQIRELIKDFWYRNQQEKRLGELAIELAEVRLAKEHARMGIVPSEREIIVNTDTAVLAAGLMESLKLHESLLLDDVDVVDDEEDEG